MSKTKELMFSMQDAARTANPELLDEEFNLGVDYAMHKLERALKDKNDCIAVGTTALRFLMEYKGQWTSDNKKYWTDK